MVWGKVYRWKVVVCAFSFHLPHRSIKLLLSLMESWGPFVPTFTSIEKLKLSSLCRAFVDTQGCEKERQWKGNLSALESVRN